LESSFSRSMLRIIVPGLMRTDSGDFSSSDGPSA